jgi:hypothetical protein
MIPPLQLLLKRHTPCACVSAKGSVGTVAWDGFSAFSAKFREVQIAAGDFLDRAAIGKPAGPKSVAISCSSGRRAIPVARSQATMEKQPYEQ